MKKALITLLVLGLFMLSYIIPVIAPEGPQPSDTSGSSGGGGGGGSRQITIDNLLKTVQDAKKKKPAKLEELKTLLWKDPITSENYTLPVVLMYYTGNNTTVSRTEPLEVMTVITNNNPLEMRRMLDLYLEVRNPGSDEYERMNKWPEKIQANEYSDKSNTTYRIWGDLPNFEYLKKIGSVRIRANASDGVNKWSTSGYKDVKPPFYSELVFNVTNVRPEIRNATVVGIDKNIPGKPVRYTEPISYEADAYDPDGDLLNATLHVIDDKGNFRENITQQVKGGSHLSIMDRDWGIFNENDAGHNFTYYYTFDDGIESGSTDVLSGPIIKSTPKLKITDFKAVPETANNFWWQRYDFFIKASSQNPEPVDVTVSLFTTTPSEKDKLVESKTVALNSIPQVIQFSVWPFSVNDAGSEFRYYLTFSEDIQGQEGRTVFGEMGLPINPRIVRFGIISWPGLNLALLLLLCLIIGMFVERRFFR